MFSWMPSNRTHFTRLNTQWFCHLKITVVRGSRKYWLNTFAMSWEVSISFWNMSGQILVLNVEIHSLNLGQDWLKVTMVFWVVVPYDLVSGYQRFRGTRWLRLQIEGTVYNSTWHQNPKYCSWHLHCFLKLKSCVYSDRSFNCLLSPHNYDVCFKSKFHPQVTDKDRCSLGRDKQCLGHAAAEQS